MSVIQAGNTTTTSLVYRGDTTGNLVFTTGGANTVALTLSNVQAATFASNVTVSSSGITYSDGTTQTSATGFPAGTKMLFVQTAAPTGWTKDTTYNNYALRVVSGTAGTGGSVAFTTAFASQTPTGTVGTSGATTLTEAQMPYHLHGYYTQYLLGSTPGLTGAGICGAGAQLGPTNFEAIAPQNTGYTGSSGSHTHAGGTFTGSAINLAVQYVDTIICTKS